MILQSIDFAEGAAIVNISSSRDRMRQPQTESYTAAKGGIYHGFKKFNVVEDFTDNGFQWFRDAQLLCAGAPRHVLAQTA